jgi:hypothetical protein
MNKNIFVFILLSISCLKIPAQTNRETKNLYKISGKIIETTSDKGVPYATIQVFNINKKSETIASADVLGEFNLYVKYTGSYLLRFDAMGYGADSLMVEITEVETNIGQIMLSEGQQLEGVTVSAKKLIM